MTESARRVPRYPVCPHCGAMAFGNMDCTTCLRHWGFIAPELLGRLLQGIGWREYKSWFVCE